jgi:hypothetical protein
MRCVALLIVVPGCFSYGATAGISHGKDDHVFLEPAVAVEARNLSDPSDHDRALFVYWGVGGRIERRLQDGRIRGGPLTSFGVSYFRGRYGVMALGTVAGALRPHDNDNDAIARFQIGFEIEGGASDWRLIEQEPRACPGFADTKPRIANRTHVVVGVLPGVQYDSSGGTAVSLSASFRQIREAGPCAAIGP